MDNPPEKQDENAETEPLETNPLPEEETTQGIITTGVIKAGTGEINIEPSLRFAKRCHPGAVRERNEDSCFIFVSETGGDSLLTPFGLFIVADGMGGHEHGNVASKIASRVAAQHILTKIYLPMLQDGGRPNVPIQEVLEEAVQIANTAVYQNDLESDSGTTLTAALILGRRLFAAHVGDSSLFLQTEEGLEKVTHDHSLVQQLQDVGHQADEITLMRYGHILIRAVGQAEEVDVDTYTRALPKKGHLLICSDGLSGRGMVPMEDIETILSRDISEQEMANMLFNEAMDAGGYDNISAIVVSFDL